MAHVTSKTKPILSPLIDLEARRSRRRRWALGLAVALGGVALSLGLYAQLHVRERQLMEMHFHLDAQDRAESFRRAVVDRLVTVRAVSAFFAGSELATRDEFGTFSEPLLETYEGVRFLAWVPRIRLADRPAHETAVQQEGFADYRITELNAKGDYVVAGERDEYYPVTFIEPFRSYRSHFGYDLGSNAVYGAALRAALASGEPVAAVSPRLDRRGTRGNRLVVVEPVWKKYPKTVKRPRDGSDIDGFVLGVFDIGAITNEAMAVFHPLGIDTYIYDSTGKDQQHLIAVRLSSLHGLDVDLKPSPAEVKPPQSSVHYLTTIIVADRRWTVDCVPLDVYFTGQGTREPEGALLAGLLITGLAVGWLMLLTGRTARVEQRVAERSRELRESDQRFRRLVDNAGDGFFLRDEQWRIRDVNQRACDSLGYTREELLSMTITDIDTEFTAKNLARYAKLSSEAYPVSFEGTHRRKDGTTFPVEIRLSSVDSGGERLMISLARDITERKRSEVALRNEQRLLRDLLALHERDRQLVAYEIHDGLAQQLTGALYKLESMEHATDRGPEAARQILDEGLRLLREAMAECRRLISGLRPPVLDEAGVVAAIDSLVSEQRQDGGPKIEFVHRVEFERMAPPVETAAFRIVQECLTNACRYSQSEKVVVGLWQVNGRLHIDVQDWGIGFDPEQVESGHFGLQGVRERARLLGGVAIIRAVPAQGTHITVELPLLVPGDNGGTGQPAP